MLLWLFASAADNNHYLINTPQQEEASQVTSIFFAEVRWSADHIKTEASGWKEEDIHDQCFISSSKISRIHNYAQVINPYGSRYHGQLLCRGNLQTLAPPGCGWILMFGQFSGTSRAKKNRKSAAGAERSGFSACSFHSFLHVITKTKTNTKPSGNRQHKTKVLGWKY